MCGIADLVTIRQLRCCWQDFQSWSTVAMIQPGLAVRDGSAPTTVIKAKVTPEGARREDE